VAAAHAGASIGTTTTASRSARDVAALQQARTAALPDSADISAAEVWRGRLLDPSGAATSGTVVAYVRANADGIAAVANANPDEALIPIARADVGANGTFVLRADYDPSYAPLQAADGSLTMMLVASSGAAIGFQLKTVWWSQPAQAAGTWTNTAPSSTAGAQSQGANDSFNPTDIQLQSTTAASGAALRSAGRSTDIVSASISPPFDCVHWQTSAGPDSKAYIGESYLQKSAYWRSTFAYTQTGTSSFQVGWSAAAGSSFTAAGSETTSSTNGAAGGAPVNSNASSATGRKHWITVHTALNQWRCWNSPTTPPASPGDWPAYYTLEEGSWARDFASDPVGVPTCGVNVPANQFVLGPGHSIARDNGSSTTISGSVTGSISGGAGPITFSFGASVHTDTTLSTLVNYGWTNTSTGNKDLCGRNGPVISGNTQVVAIGNGT
jgi:hypothetical protein